MRPHRERLDGTVLTSRLTRRGRVPTSSAAVRLGPKREAVAARLVPGERPPAADADIRETISEGIRQIGAILHAKRSVSDVSRGVGAISTEPSIPSGPRS